jgi:protein-L-isoaspartate(D-aspartate) O-methyltransferase
VSPAGAADGARPLCYGSVVSRELAHQLRGMGIRDERVLAAIERVPRERFVPADLREVADADRPLPIGYGQTISQPFIVAFMTEWLRLDGDERVLEVGTGSGYQAAVLAALAGEVFSLEVVPELSAGAAAALADLGITNVHLRVGDGRRGWPEEAPFDRVVLTAAPLAIPEPLVRQLAPGGRLLAPVGPAEDQVLRLVTRDHAGALAARDILPVRFVPLTGEDPPPASPKA